MTEASMIPTDPVLVSFRALMAGFPTGVAIVTTVDSRGRPQGMTCSSISSVTLRPPTLLVCLRDQSPTLRAIEERAAFTVNLLRGQARGVAELFASGNPDRFDLVRWQAGHNGGGPRLFDDAHAIADCVISDTRHVGDHVVVFGTTERISVAETPNPLLYGLRSYRRWDDFR